LVVFPDVVARMTSNMQWTTDLGNAFIAQQGDVMNAVQMLRAQARASGRLNSTPQQNVITDDQGQQGMIEIQPADQQTLYVPNYNPEYVWGAPGYGYYYPSLYYPSYGYGFGFGYGISIGRFFGGGLGWGGWGWSPNWYGHSVIQNNAFFSRYRFNGYSGGGRYYGAGSATWAHNPEHRMGVPYAGRGAAVARPGGYYRGDSGRAYNSGANRAPAYQSNPGYSRGNNSLQYRSAPSAGTRFQQSPNTNSGGSRGSYSDPGRNTRSYQQPAQPRGNGYQATPRSFSGGDRSTPSRGFQSSPNRAPENRRQSTPRSSNNNSGGGRPTPSSSRQSSPSSASSSHSHHGK